MVYICEYPFTQLRRTSAIMDTLSSLLVHYNKDLLQLKSLHWADLCWNDVRSVSAQMKYSTSLMQGMELFCTQSIPVLQSTVLHRVKLVSQNCVCPVFSPTWMGCHNITLSNVFVLPKLPISNIHMWQQMQMLSNSVTFIHLRSFPLYYDFWRWCRVKCHCSVLFL
jgi:hypothetical protein